MSLPADYAVWVSLGQFLYGVAIAAVNVLMVSQVFSCEEKRLAR